MALFSRFSITINGFIFFLFMILLKFAAISSSIPFVVLHGIGSSCSNHDTQNLTQELIIHSRSPGHCIEVGDGIWSSWFTPMHKQVEIVCEKVKNIKELENGYNLVALSQGNLIARGIIQLCDGGPPVKNYVSLAGPHAGIVAPPLCGSNSLCSFEDTLIRFDVYSEFVQAHLAPSGYMKLPNNMMGYLSGCKFLPMLNNEISNQRNSTYKIRFSSLQNLVLIMFENDEVLVPKETSWFGFYPDGQYQPVLQPEKTKLYEEDWIGLKMLAESGRVQYIMVGGSHIDLSHNDMIRYVVPYLKTRELI
ncbi:palmitoyl-protein thioesterase 1-like [Impatiens glandulifera]|uniref:palmitoyl-protein thioesterase 1-like n=1 Tax=Impatiens glandulifera TaxID=253017 RepID=UPI001FB104F5|nr:palmitoyl-protein thioesterase 1-like [Impatiens glandulifera]